MADRIVTPRAWLWKPRTYPIKIIEIHSTRGGTTSPAIDYLATGNWMENPNNGSAIKGWGSSCSFVLGPGGELTTVLQDNQMPTYSAGYGVSGPPIGYSLDQYGISYEWAQPNINTPFSDAMYRRGAKEIAKKCVAYGIPPVFVTAFNQKEPAPAGLIRHDRCENGTKLGKSDPGPQFNEAYFIQLLTAEIAALQEENMPLNDADKQWIWDAIVSILRAPEFNVGAINSRVAIMSPKIDLNHSILFDPGNGDAASDLRRLIYIGNNVKKITTGAPLTDEQLAAIAKAVADEIHRRTAS